MVVEPIVSADVATRLARARAALDAVTDPEIPVVTIAELGILRAKGLDIPVVVGGIISSTILTLLVLPVLYRLVLRERKTDAA